MKLKYDKTADAIYIKLSNMPYAYGKDLDDLRRIDYASGNTPRGVELLCVSEGVNIDDLPYADEITEMLEANGIKTYTTAAERGYSGLVFNINLTATETGKAVKPREGVTGVAA